MPDSVHDLSAAYALDALDDRERREFEAHLDGCERCRDEVDSFRMAAASLATADPAPAPPPELRTRLLDAARAERPNVVPLKPRRNLWRPAAALASAVAVAAVLWGVVLSNRISDRDDALSVLADPSARRLPLAGAGDAALVVTPSGDAAIVGDFRDTPNGKAYEAWIITDRPHRAGMLGSGGRKTVVLDGTLPNGATVAITLEREGGVDSPTSKPLASVRA